MALLPLATSPLDLTGPEFLSFYFWALAATIIGVMIWKRLADRTSGSNPPLLPQDIDAHELAWLRGGMPNLVELSGLELMQRGYLRARSDGPGLEVDPAAPPLTGLSAGMASLLEVFRTDVNRSTILREGTRALRQEEAALEARAQEEQLLISPALKRQAQWLGWALIFGFLGLGAAKISVALGRGHHNIGGLIFLMILAFIALAIVMSLPRLSRRGKAYLSQAQTALAELKPQASTLSESRDPMLILAVAAFGVGLLETTSFASYQQVLQPPPRVGTSSDSSGSSCSSSDSGGGGDSGGSSCSSGSSCGGCGGGGD